MAYVEVKDMRVHYERSGRGDPLILLLGAGSTIDDAEYGWAKLRKSFEREFEVTILEHRGHGLTNNPATLFDYETLADDLAMFATKLGIENFHCAGLSDGAITAMHLAMTVQGLLRSVVLVGANYRNDERTRVVNERISMIADLPDDSPIATRFSTRHVGDETKTDYWRELFAGIAANVSSYPDYSPHDLTKIQCPTLLLAGEHDPYANLDQLTVMRRNIPHSELCIINNAGHDVQGTRPEITGEVILDFLRRH